MTGRTKELLRKASELSSEERSVLLQSALLLPMVWAGLRVVPLRRLLRLLDGHPEPKNSGPQDVSRARAFARLVTAAARYGPVPSTCLTRSIVTWRILRRRGMAADIRIGLREGSRPIAAHAWVEVGGLPVNDADDVAGRHTVFDGGLAPER